jgi:hypothetical protein
MTEITITATIPEHLLDRAEHAEEQWEAAENASDWEKEEEPDRERECQERAHLAYAAIGRAVVTQYYASLTGEADHE